jgi:uncharacterized protein HemY
MKRLLLPLPIALGLAVASCSHPGSSGTSPVKPAVAVDPAAAVAAVRAAGEGVDSAVQVQPLRDPSIDGFLQRAETAERARDYRTAVAAADEALKLAPEAPDILQYLAELELARGDWTRAEELAMKSFNLGPQVGSLCARNWQTLVESRTALADEASVADARRRVQACRVPPPPRM